jgi:hypothetical protein
MTLKIMIAGCAKDERDKIEASIKTAMGDRPARSDWNLSVVNIANQWSVEIDGPEPHFARVSLIATTSDLIEKLEQALSEAESKVSVTAAAPAATAPAATAPAATAPAATAPTATAPTAESGKKQERHTCEECAALFDVIFDYTAGEPEELCPVACPACWHVNRVPIAVAAGATGDYRAQTAM